MQTPGMLCEDDEASPGISYLIAIKEGIEFDGKGACSYTDRPNQIRGIDATPKVTIDDGRVSVFAAVDNCTAQHPLRDL